MNKDRISKNKMNKDRISKNKMNKDRISKNKMNKARINLNMNIQEIVKKFPEVEKILLEKGMHCLTCPFSNKESLKEGAIGHGINPKKLVKELNKKIKNIK